jgi:hypothetical protein
VNATVYDQLYPQVNYGNLTPQPAKNQSRYDLLAAERGPGKGDVRFGERHEVAQKKTESGGQLKCHRLYCYIREFLIVVIPKSGA